MAEATHGVVNATFPDPPPFYKHFTVENLKGAKKHHLICSTSSGDSPHRQAQRVELRFLVPPRPPIAGKYRCFRAQYDVNEVLPSLTDQGIEQLYPFSSTDTPKDVAESQAEWSVDRASHIKKIAQSILLNFLELVGVLAQAPSEYGPKIDDFNVLFFNAHHLINEYRPHQARETLIIMMEEQLRQKHAEIETVRRTRDKLDALLGNIGREDSEHSKELEGMVHERSHDDEKWRSAQRTMWQTINDDLEC